MEASCFGFEEDEAAVTNDREMPSRAKFIKPTFRFVCNVPSKFRVAGTVVQNVYPPEAEQSSNITSPISISQVKDLLLEDLSPTRESSFYEELQNEETQSELETSVEVGPEQNTENLERTPVRVFGKPTRNKKKVLGEIQNLDDTENAMNVKKTPVRVFGKTTRIKKRPLEEIQNFDSSIETSLQDSIVKPVAKKRGKKEVENEKNEILLNELAERMNSKFKAVDEFQLIVE